MPAASKVPPVDDRSSDSEEYEYEEVEVEEEIEVEEEVSDEEEEEIEEIEEVEEEESEEEEEEEDTKIAPTAAPVKDRSPTVSDTEEYEYEETEVEEEIEVEEEVSDDEEEEIEEEEEEEEAKEEEEEEVEEEQKEGKEPEKRSGEDASRLIEYPNDVKIDEEQKEGKELEKTSEEDVSRSIEDRDDVKIHEDQKEEKEHEERSGEDVLRSIENRDDVKREEKIISDDEKASQCDGGIMTAETTNPINESSKPVTVGDSVDESDKVPRSEEQTTLMYTKDVNDAHLKEPRLDVEVTLKRSQSLSPAVEVNEGNKRPALVCEFFAKGWCIKGTSCKFLHIKDPFISVVDQQNGPLKSQPQDEGVRESTGRPGVLVTSATASTLIKCSSELKPGSQEDNPKPVPNLPVNGSLGNPFMGSNTHRSSWTSFAPKIESGKGYHFGLLNHNYNSSYNGTVWHRTPSLKADPKFSSYDWELSKPFRSRFLISQGISTTDVQYDPFRDSIEQPTKTSDKLPKLSSSSRVPSISGTHSPLEEKLKTEYGSDRISIGSHVNGNDNDDDMDVDSNEIADTKQDNTKSESKGKKQIGDVIQASETNASGHYSLRKNDDGPTKEVTNYKLEFDAERDMHRESKSTRHFRASLIDFVKELVRPSWRDGKLSKDAHKLIVKKAVDKVLTSLPPEHVPNIQESIDAYLTSSRPKLMKLVEGYVEKYGKVRHPSL